MATLPDAEMDPVPRGFGIDDTTSEDSMIHGIQRHASANGGRGGGMPGVRDEDNSDDDLLLPPPIRQDQSTAFAPTPVQRVGKAAMHEIL